MIIQGDAMSLPLASNSVQCVVTSPPYWGLRDYGQVGQIGLEPTPEAYVAKIVAVFAEVWRVLRDDGTCWVNLGDSYNSSTQFNQHSSLIGDAYCEGKRGDWPGHKPYLAGLKPKDLVGIPWRVAFALQAAGWYLRSDIIWSKPNPMPESVTDRPTKAHEYIFLLTKRERYYFDQDAVRETTGNEMSWDEYAERTAPGATWPSGGMMNYAGAHKHDGGHAHPNGRNIRTVWEIATQPYPDAHFATFPEEIAKRCILAGTSERGACVECGAPWERVTDKTLISDGKSAKRGTLRDINDHRVEFGQDHGSYEVKTLGWQPRCKHKEVSSVGCRVLDPFCGSGTVVQVAQDLGRISIGVDVKLEYIKMARRRSAQLGFGMCA
jgi:DNA modification methylase